MLFEARKIMISLKSNNIPPFSAGEYVHLKHDLVKAKVISCKKAPQAEGYYCELEVDGRKIGPRLARELEHYGPRLAYSNPIQWSKI